MIMFEKQYRVDFYYWNKEGGFHHVERVDDLDYPIPAKEYVEEIENTASFFGLSKEGYGMPITNYDAIFVRVVDNENDYPLSDYWWWNTKKESTKYIYPSFKGIINAIAQGWSEEDAERGFCIVDFHGTGMLEIEAIADAHIDNNSTYNDGLAAREAERIGYCKIIPVDELPNPFIYNGINRRYFGWVDTPENRKRIEEFCKK